jgi:glutamate dehydrogenase
VHDSLPLSDFDAGNLSATCVFHDVSKQKGVRARNSIHTRVKSDLFILAGGQPNKINVNTGTSL